MPAPFALYSLDYPPERGGVARYLGDLATAARGDLDVYVPETHDVSGPGTVRVLPSFSSGPWPWRKLVASFWRLRPAGYRSLLISHLLPVGTAAALARRAGGLPYAVLVHGLDLRLAAGHRSRRHLARWVLRGAQAVFANSERVAGELRAFVPGLRPAVVTPGVWTRSFLPRATARARLGIEPGVFLCLTVARLVTRKGIDAFIRVLAEMPKDVRYVVVGEGLDRERLQALVRTCGVADRVAFLSGCPDEERDAWLAAADLFVFLAREEGADFEGFGIAPLEASLAGLPVLAGRSGGVAEAVVHAETGLLVDPNDPSAILETFFRLYQDPALRERLGRAGRIRAERDFRWEERWERLRQRLGSQD